MTVKLSHLISTTHPLITQPLHILLVSLLFLLQNNLAVSVQLLQALVQVLLGMLEAFKVGHLLFLQTHNLSWG